jgi:hypothetical protein
MSEIDDRMAEDRERNRMAEEPERLKQIRDLADGERFELLAYLNRHAARQVHDWLWDREADSTGTRYDAWGRAFIVLIGVAFASVVVLIALNPAGSLW